jgi:chromosomal replication initiation ATPase DnaA
MITPHDSTRQIIQSVARLHQVKVAELMGRRRFRPIVRARQDAIRRVAEAKPHLSISQLGRIFDRDHSTILWAMGRLSRQQSGRRAS